MSQTARHGDLLETRVELRLAEETALMRIVGIARIGELRGVDKNVLGAYLAGDNAGFVHLLGSIGLRQAGCRHRARTECSMRDL